MLFKTERALKLYHRFKNRVVMTLPTRWTMSRSRIRAYVIECDSRSPSPDLPLAYHRLIRIIAAARKLIALLGLIKSWRSLPFCESRTDTRSETSVD
jgi:hypothetical protein